MTSIKKQSFLILTLLALVSNLFCITAYAEAVPQIVVSDSSAEAGSEVDVKVSIQNNPGIISVLLNLEYNNEYLELTKVADGKKLGSTFFGNKLTAMPYKMNWNDDTSMTNMTYNGEFVTLTFKVKDNAPAGVYPVKMSYNNGDIYDVDLDPVTFTVKNGSITVEKPDVLLDYTITSLQIKDGNDEAIDKIPESGNIYVEVTAIKNTDRNERDYLIIATYGENGVFLDMTYMRSLYSKGQEVTFGVLLDSTRVKKVKAFVWEGLTSLKVLSNTSMFE